MIQRSVLREKQLKISVLFNFLVWRGFGGWRRFGGSVGRRSF